MGKDEFLRKLEYLLSDIQEEEKREALDYYRDYLEEAGPEREDEVLREFGSPERIAAIIRVDLEGGMEDAGEFTDQGYSDQRFERASYPVPGNTGRGYQEDNRAKGPYNSCGDDPGDKGGFCQEPGNSGKDPDSYQEGSYAEKRRMEKRNWGFVRILLTAALICVAIPILFSAGIGAVGALIGIGAALLAVLLALAALTLAGLLGGVSLFILGVTHLAPELWFGLMCIGLGLMALGISCLLFLGSYLFYGRFLPWLAACLGKCFGRERRREAKEAQFGGRGRAVKGEETK